MLFVSVSRDIYCSFIFFHLPGFHLHWQQAKQDIPSILFPSNAFQGDPKPLPGQTRYLISPASSGSTPGSTASWVCLKNLHIEFRRHPDQQQEPQQEGVAPLLPSVCLSSSPISKDNLSLQRKLILTTCTNNVIRFATYMWWRGLPS